MTGLLGFCAFMTFVYMPYDFFWKSVDRDQEVWLGFLLTGWAAKATEPLHWAIYAAGTYGFWKMRPWLHPWAALYTASVAIGMLVWGARVGKAGELAVGALGSLAFGALAAALWRARGRFGTRAPVSPG